jgi:hypothetical protein
MSSEELKSYPCLNANDKYPEQSIQENIDLTTFEGHVFRDSSTGKFVCFDNHLQATNWFMSLDRPQVHSVATNWFMSLDRPQVHSVALNERKLRLNLELDIPTDRLDSQITFTEKVVKDAEKQGVDILRVKYSKVLEHIEESVDSILEDWGIEASDHPFHRATDHRKGKFSVRLYKNLAFANKKQYVYFCNELKNIVKPQVVEFIDPTGLCLRTPGSYKDNHRAVWNTRSSFEDSILTWVDTSADVPVQELPEKEFDCGDFEEADIKSVLGIISTQPWFMGNFSYIGVDAGVMKFSRLKPSDCICCKREHDKADAYATIWRGNAYFRCYRDDQRRPFHVGFVGASDLIDVGIQSIRQMVKQQGKEEFNAKEQRVNSNDNRSVLVDLNKQAAQNTLDCTQYAANSRYYYSDFGRFHKKVFSDTTQVEEYMHQTIFKIINGGQGLFITSDWWNDCRHYTELSQMPFPKHTEPYFVSIINRDFDITKTLSKNNQPTKQVFFFEILRDHCMTSFYRNIDFMPFLRPQDEPKHCREGQTFNMFEGFKFPFKENVQENEVVRRWEYHILNVVCNGNKAHAKVLTQWMAHIVQKPMQKSFATIIYGTQGAGKSILYEMLKAAIGKDLTLQVSKLEDITQDHNSHLRGKLIINCNEATNQPANRDINILKGLITETDLVVNPKNVNQYTINNFSRVLITSNYKQCMRLDPTDRRYFCLKVSSKWVGKSEYFDALVKDVESSESQQAFFDYLANYDISDFAHHRPPMSEMKLEMIRINIPSSTQFLRDVCENMIFDLPFPEEQEGIVMVQTVISTSELFRAYTAWCVENDAKGGRLNKTVFVDELKEKFELIQKRKTIEGRKVYAITLNRTTLLPKFKAMYHDQDMEFAPE